MDDGPRGPEPIRHVSVPKPGGGTRAIAVLGPGDGSAYERAVARLADVIERALGPGVVANRVLPGPGIRLEPWRRAQRRLLRGRAAMRAAAPVLRTDVRDCYPSIRPAMLEACLVRLGGRPDDVGRLRVILEDFEARGVRGLPIGPDPSAVLANAVLTAADRSLVAEGLGFLRWVDDIWAAAPSPVAAERALERLRDALGRIGLRLAEHKTSVSDTVTRGGISAISAL